MASPDSVSCKPVSEHIRLSDVLWWRWKTRVFSTLVRKLRTLTQKIALTLTGLGLYLLEKGRNMISESYLPSFPRSERHLGRRFFVVMATRPGHTASVPPVTDRCLCLQKRRLQHAPRTEEPRDWAGVLVYLACSWPGRVGGVWRVDTMLSSCMCLVYECVYTNAKYNHMEPLTSKTSMC